MKKSSVKGYLFDDATGKKIKAAVGFDCGKICINIDGYGEKTAAKGFGQPVVIDFFDNKLKVIVWGDIAKEDPTNIIDLKGAKEDKS